ncbi:hypothetical protein OG422_05785 [Streptomyces sp. NBC_01525]|uniref:hypothetical protein n=1 Tax=Streptomyces sp. NBC_01525 TaxID=2903893 RepID=UPI00386CA547
MTDATTEAKPAEAGEETPPEGGWPLADGGCCAACPIRAGCALAAETYRVCPITGTVPPTAPPPRAPEPPAGPTNVYDDPDALLDVQPEPGTETGPGRRFDATAVASRGVEAAISSAFGLGWTDIAAFLIERGGGRTDSEGNPVDWGRLQIKRNLLCGALAMAVPLGEHTAAGWVADTLHRYTLTAVFAPAGTAIAFAGPVVIGLFVPGFSGIARFIIAAACTAGRAVVWVVRSRLGWVITRPAIWAVIGGIALLTGRALLRFFTGA